MNKKSVEYYIGNDMGTESIGWAVTDCDYNIQKFNGKHMWGIRLFEAADTAEQRRVYRTGSRRLKRRKQRIDLLQELFAEEIAKVDMGFYQRLKDSKYYIEDKNEYQANTLFNDAGYSDKNFHMDNKTIYHLRKKLIQSKESFDVRLVYLALHHIMKKRGHFLFEGKSFESIKKLETSLNELTNNLRDEYNLDLVCSNYSQVEKILKDSTLNITTKHSKLKKEFSIKSNQKQEAAMLGLICGKKTKLKDIFLDDTLDELENSSISFKDAKYDEIEVELESILEERFYCLQLLKSIYDWSILVNILRDKDYISYAKVDIYEDHKKDLENLKYVVNKYIPEQYKNIFVNPNCKNNYCSYIGMTKKNNKKCTINKKCTQDEFCKFIEKILKGIEVEDYVLEEMKIKAERRTLLPKQINSSNSVIPYQVNYEELKIILENASLYLPFLNNIDENGRSVKDKIKSIFMFRIPYYVGPINDANKDKTPKQCWVVKKYKEKVLPWNFEEVIDIEQSAINFIEKMTNKCTYLIGEDVLPKNSILYSDFMVLDELNNLKINGEKISVDLKQSIYNDLFMNYKKVSLRGLTQYLKNEGKLTKEDEISGIDEDFKSDLTSRRDFNKIIKEKAKNTEMVEEIIKWIVLFSDDKKLLKRRIRNVYGDVLTENEINQISNLRYKGWARLSKAFLKEIYHIDKSTGEYQSIITNMWNTNKNHMELLSSNYDYLNEIEKYNDNKNGNEKELNYDILEEFNISPAVKRQIWQALLINKEIVKIMGHEPKKIFIEVAREKEESKRTISRKGSLISLYKKCQEEKRDWINELEQREENDFRSDRLYLYYTQMGKCMYTGKPITLEDLFNRNIYDIDHIYPQSKVKDDSLDNRVLVLKESNKIKSDKYPIEPNIQKQQRAYWDMLLKKELISKKKYERLTRTTTFTNDELAGFISRQLVENRQATKIVANILKKFYKDTEIVYVKAGNVSDFRHKFNIVKVREINDYHHAKDAYLNIVVGNVYNTKFTHNPVNFIKNSKYREYSLNKMYDFDVENKNTVAWKVGDKGTIKTVKNTVNKNNILFTRYSYIKKGQLFDLQPVKKDKNKKGELIPLKGKDDRLNDTSKYGGYNSIKQSYYILVEHERKGKLVRSILSIPVYLVQNIEKDKNALEKFCINKLGDDFKRILIDKIKIDTLFKLDGFYMHISGKTENNFWVKPAHQLILGEKYEKYMKKIIKFANRYKELDRKIKINKKYDEITVDENVEIYDLFIHKLKNTIYNNKFESQGKTLEENYENFINATIEEQCIVLSQILNIFACNAVAADLTLIGGVKSAGKIKISSRLENFKEAKIINQSPTGLFESEVNLKGDFKDELAYSSNISKVKN